MSSSSSTHDVDERLRLIADAYGLSKHESAGALLAARYCCLPRFNSSISPQCSTPVVVYRMHDADGTLVLWCKRHDFVSHSQTEYCYEDDDLT